MAGDATHVLCGEWGLVPICADWGLGADPGGGGVFILIDVIKSIIGGCPGEGYLPYCIDQDEALTLGGFLLQP